MNRLFEAYRTTIGKKFVVAVTGVILFLFVLGHMLGNLQIFVGAERLNAYAAFLQSTGEILFAVRTVLLVAFLLHMVAVTQLFFQNMGARPVRYRVKHTREMDYSARTMIYTGPIILAFVAYHLLHFTFGSVHPDFVHGDVYHNVVSGFSIWWVSGIYMVANILLGIHFKHGLWSWFQTLGLAHPKYNHWRSGFATFFAYLIIAGNVSMPLAVLAGWIK
jgi:succinate dehydrogenase / fumarate reductase, cytochrome b subunit